MPISIYWEDDTKRIIRWDFDGSWTWEDVYKASRDAVTLREKIAYPVVVFVDQRRAANIVPSGAVHHLSNLIHMGRESRRLLVILSPFEFYHQLARILIGVYREIGRKIVMVRTMEEADIALAPFRIPQTIVTDTRDTTAPGSTDPGGGSSGDNGSTHNPISGVASSGADILPLGAVP